MTAAIVAWPSILRSLTCPLMTRLKSRISAASSVGSEPWVFTELVELGLRCLALEVAQLVDRTALHRRRRPRPAERLAQPRVAVDHRQQRGAQPPSLQGVDEARPRVAGFAAAQLQREEFLAAVGENRHGREHGHAR